MRRVPSRHSPRPSVLPRGSSLQPARGRRGQDCEQPALNARFAAKRQGPANVVGTILARWVVIDDKGRECAIERTLCELKGSLTEKEYIDFLTINCGFAAFRLKEQSIHVQFRPDILAGKALVELLFRVYDAPWRRALATTFVKAAWRHDILPADRAQVIRRLSDMVMDSQTQPHRAVLRRSRPAQSVPSPMGKILHEWHNRPETPSRELRRALVQEIEGRYVWVNGCENGDLIMTEVGRGFPKRVGAALQPGIGHRLQDQPDVVFGRYCAEVYGTAAGLECRCSRTLTPS